MVATLGLGAVQFGIDYGISNELGRTKESEVLDILALAGSKSISIIDTAPGYGCSEKVLGSSDIASQNFKVVTKTPHLGKHVFGTTSELEDYVVDSFEKSLDDLGLNSTYALLVHSPEDLLGEKGEGVYNALCNLKNKGKVEKIGVSVYNPQEIGKITDQYLIDVVQIPFNIYDQRFHKSGCLHKLKSMGVEVHARSVFMQGLLLMETNSMPAHFKSIAQHHNKYLSFIKERELSSLEAAISFVRNTEGIDTMVVGVNTKHQLSGVINAYAGESNFDFSGFSLDDDAIINPTNWVV